MQSRNIWICRPPWFPSFVGKVPQPHPCYALSVQQSSLSFTSVNLLLSTFYALLLGQRLSMAHLEVLIVDGLAGQSHTLISFDCLHWAFQPLSACKLVNQALRSSNRQLVNAVRDVYLSKLHRSVSATSLLDYRTKRQIRDSSPTNSLHF